MITINGEGNFTTQMLTISFNGGTPVSVPFINEGGSGMDEYGTLEISRSNIAGFRLWLDSVNLCAAP